MSFCSFIEDMYNNVSSLLLEYLFPINPISPKPGTIRKVDIKDDTIEPLMPTQLAMDPEIKRHQVPKAA